MKILKARSACYYKNTTLYYDMERLRVELWECGLQCPCGFKATSWAKIEIHFSQDDWEDIKAHLETEYKKSTIRRNA